MTYNFQDIINLFLNGETSGRAGSKSAPGNLGIQGDQLLHYTTPIMERSEKGIIVNLSQYSIQTGRVQKMIKETLGDKDYMIVRRVPRDYKGSLQDFLVSKEGGGNNENTI